MNAVTGIPGADYLIHQRSCSCERSGEFGLFKCSRGHGCWASTSTSQLADETTYYSCHHFYKKDGYKTRPYIVVDPGGFEPPTFSMPLRRAPNCAMGPGIYLSERCGPEGIRTPDLLSAIEARSQLRYRPVVQKARAILPEGGGNVNKGDVKNRGNYPVGSNALIVDPRPTPSDSTHILPPCASMMPLAMVKPMPNPPC